VTTLYKLANQYIGLSNLDVPEEDLQDTFDALEGEIQIKAENLLAVVTNMDADAVAIDTEIKRLTKRKTAITNRQAYLREYLRHNMSISGVTKITCPLFTITLAKGRPIAIINDDTLLPAKYVKTTVSSRPIKADILSALKAGQDVPGAVLGTSAESLRIK